MVVNPEQVSKKESMKLGMAPLAKAGTAPIREASIHARDTIKKPSLAFAFFSEGGIATTIMLPIKIVAVIVSKNGTICFDS